MENGTVLCDMKLVRVCNCMCGCDMDVFVLDKCHNMICSVSHTVRCSNSAHSTNDHILHITRRLSCTNTPRV
jgi:hypothetical protein